MATFAIGTAGAANAALFAVAMLATTDAVLRQQLEVYRARQTELATRHERRAALSRTVASSSSRFIPGATLGVMGGGQLSRMFVPRAQQLGYFTAVLDPRSGQPAGWVAAPPHRGPDTSTRPASRS